MRTEDPTTLAQAREGGVAGRARGLLGTPLAVLLVLGAITLAMGFQFITDASRAVPAFDTAFYQWRVEYLLSNDPGALIELRGALGSLAGGYRVAEPVAGALLRTVGGVEAPVPTIVLSVMLRVLAAAGLAAFAFRYRGRWGLYYITLIAVPALFLLQRFFGFLDNFMTLALLAGVLLLLEPMRTSWTARVTAVLFMLIGGLSHPTTLAIFLVAMGILGLYRWIRERSFVAALRSEGPMLIAGAVAVVLTAGIWMGGLWGPTSSFSDAAVPPPEDVSYFLNRSLSVLGNMTPYLMVPLLLVGAVYLLVRLWKDHDYFSEVSLAWTLPLGGMFGFLIGAAYPYFRFFNATLAPLLLVSVGLWLLVVWAARVRRGGAILPVAAVVLVALVLGLWWVRGLGAWNSTSTWLTPEIREQTSAMAGYLRAAPEGTKAVVVTDAQPGRIVPYGKYKEFANATYAGVDGARIDDVTLYFGTVEDFQAGRASTSENEPYNEISAETTSDATELLRSGDPVVVFLPAVFNEESPNAELISTCEGAGGCVPVGDSGVVVLPDGTAPSDEAVEAGARAAEESRSFVAEPPGPLSGIGETILDLLRLGLLLLVPGYLVWRRLPGSTWVDGMVLVPLISLALTTTVGVAAMGILRGPFTGAVGWGTWAVAVLLSLVPWLWGRRAA